MGASAGRGPARWRLLPTASRPQACGALCGGWEGQQGFAGNSEAAFQGSLVLPGGAAECCGAHTIHAGHGLRSLISLQAAHHSQGELAYPDGEFGAHRGGSQGRTASRLHSRCPGLVTGLVGHWRPGRLKQKGLSYSCVSRGRILGVWGGLPIGAAWAGIPAPVRSRNSYSHRVLRASSWH